MHHLSTSCTPQQTLVLWRASFRSIKKSRNILSGTIVRLAFPRSFFWLTHGTPKLLSLEVLGPSCWQTKKLINNYWLNTSKIRRNFLQYSSSLKATNNLGYWLSFVLFLVFSLIVFFHYDFSNVYLQWGVLNSTSRKTQYYQ